jgi:Ca2+-binding RTX toxin-like protein
VRRGAGRKAARDMKETTMVHLIGGNGYDLLEGGNGNDILEGLGGPDVLRGYGGNDALYGGSGDDQMDGGAGNDSLLGDIGNDIIFASSGNDSVNGGSGTDSLLFYDSADVFINLNPALPNVNKANQVGEGVTTFTSVEVFWTDDGNDGLIGNDQANTFLSGGGNDGLYGYGGNDWLNGGDDDDTLSGGNGSDLVEGADGDDVVVGGSGNDYLWGGFGVDTLTGGSGADDFRFQDGDSGVGAGNRDLITDFSKAAGDDIDLATFGNLDFIGQDTFDAPDQVRFFHDNGDTIIRINTVGNGGAEMEIQLDGVINFAASDFIL